MSGTVVTFLGKKYEVRVNEVQTPMGSLVVAPIRIGGQLFWRASVQWMALDGDIGTAEITCKGRLKKSPQAAVNSLEKVIKSARAKLMSGLREAIIHLVDYDLLLALWESPQGSLRS